MRRVVLAAAAAVLAVGAGGCGASAEGSDAELLVFAAASLREVALELDAEAEYVFAGSDALAAQIRDGAEADVILSAAAGPLADLEKEGLVEEPVAFASNRLVVVVPRANPADIGEFADLGRPGVKLVLGGEGVPIGDYARQALAAARLEEALRNVVSLEEDVKGVLGKVRLNEADAGIVYATDARVARGDVDVVEMPDEVQPDVRYVAAVVTAGDRDAAGEYLDLLLGADGVRTLAEAGFGPR